LQERLLHDKDSHKHRLFIFSEAAAAVQAVTAPNYVLEESLSSQKLWKHTAGNRPPQPEEERAYMEMLWRQNFAMSSVVYQVPKEVLTAGTPISFSAFADSHYAGDSRELSSYGNLATDSMATGAELAEAIERLHGNTREGGPQRIPHEVVNKQVKGPTSKEDLTVLIRGDNVFGTTVSKSFDRTNMLGNREVDTVNISIASYRVVEVRDICYYCDLLILVFVLEDTNLVLDVPIKHSPRKMANMLSFLSFTAKGVSETRLVFGSDIPTLKH
jgi:hypothetical protein